MDKNIETVVNEQLNAEMWSSGLYIAIQVYFKDQQMPMLSSWLDMQIHRKFERIRKMSEFLLSGGYVVSFDGLTCKAETWQSPMLALDALFAHEQYFYRQVADFLHWVRGVDDLTLRCLAFDLYADEMHMSDFVVELLRILTKEWRRRLPLE